MEVKRAGTDEFEMALQFRREKRYEEGLVLLKQSADLMNPDASFEMYYATYYGGWGLESNVLYAKTLLAYAANAGSEMAYAQCEAEVLLGGQRTHGYHRIYDDVHASERHFSPVFLSYFGDLRHPYARALFYFAGYNRRIPHINRTRLIQLLSKAASKKCHFSLYAQYDIAILHFMKPMGEGEAVLPIEDGLYWLKMAADGGHALAQAEYCHRTCAMDRPVEYLRLACRQGRIDYCDFLANVLTWDPNSSGTEIAECKIKAMYFWNSSKKERTYRPCDIKGNLASRISNMAVVQWRRMAIKSVPGPTSIKRDEYRSIPALKFVPSLRRDLQELYVYGRELLKIKPEEMRKFIEWDSSSDKACCSEIKAYPRGAARRAAVAFLTLKRRPGQYNHVLKEFWIYIAKTIWASRLDPIVWLK